MARAVPLITVESGGAAARIAATVSSIAPVVASGGRAAPSAIAAGSGWGASPAGRVCGRGPAKATRTGASVTVAAGVPGRSSGRTVGAMAPKPMPPAVTGSMTAVPERAGTAGSATIVVGRGASGGAATAAVIVGPVSGTVGATTVPTTSGTGVPGRAGGIMAGSPEKTLIPFGVSVPSGVARTNPRASRRNTVPGAGGSTGVSIA